MKLHEALVIFGLNYNHYDQEDIDRSYKHLCKKIDSKWKEALDEGKRTLEMALINDPVAASSDGIEATGDAAAESAPAAPKALTPKQELAELRKINYIPEKLDGRVPSTRPYDRLTPILIPNLVRPLEVFSANLTPLLYAVSAELRSVNDPRAIPPRTIGHFTAVIDLDETLVCARNGQYIVRPYARQFLTLLSEIKDARGQRAIELILFSAGEGSHVDAGRRLLDPQNTLFQYAVCRGASWMTTPPALKDISLLGRPTGTCLLVDDSPYATVINGSRALIIPTFQPEHPNSAGDTTLLYVLQVLTRVSHIFSHQITNPAPLAHPIPGFGRKLTLEAPAFRAALTAIGAKKSVPEAAVCAAEAAKNFRQTQHAKITALLAVTAVKMQLHAKPHDQFTEEALAMLLRDRLFVAAIDAIRTKKSTAETAKYLVTVARDAGELNVEDFVADHPFTTVQSIPTVGGELHCVRLAVTEPNAVRAKIDAFRAERIRITKMHQKEMTDDGMHPIALHAAQVSRAQLLELFTQVTAWWQENTTGDLERPITALAAAAVPDTTRTETRRLSKSSLAFFEIGKERLLVDVKKWNEEVEQADTAVSVLPARSAHHHRPISISYESLQVLVSLAFTFANRHSNSLLLAEFSLWAKIIDQQIIEKSAHENSVARISFK